MSDLTSRKPVIRADDPGSNSIDHLVGEEPVELRLNGTSLAVLMRTPGNERDLAVGFAITEGIVTDPGEISDIVDLGEGRWDIRLADGLDVDPLRFQRNLYATSSCGVCGKASIDAIRVSGARPDPGPVIDAGVLGGVARRLRASQPTFELTGGSHAAGAFDSSGVMIAVQEDIGRHNAVDKLVGALSLQSWPLRGLGLIVSDRVSFEIVQKAAVAGIGLVAGVSAASDLAVELAAELGMTVIGFVRGGTFTLYVGPGRVGGISRIE